MTQKVLSFSIDEARSLFGVRDRHLSYLENLLGIQISARGNKVYLRGDKDDVERGVEVLSELKKKYHRIGKIEQTDLLHFFAGNPSDTRVFASSDTEPQENPSDQGPDSILINSRKHFIQPRTPRQRAYVRAIRSSDLTIGIGPAGTGKTYLAVALAIESLRNGDFHRVIFTRPALEAGERLGFLPGDLEEKIKPYLQPVYDALYDLLRYEELRRWSARKMIEIIPLAYMRGRTLNDAFIILDEAQNTTHEQMKMFLTRLGNNSRAVVTGDITQIDLPLSRERSGLVACEEILSRVREVKFIYFSGRDVVRHPLVKKIIKAYDDYAKKENTKGSVAEPPTQDQA